MLRGNIIIVAFNARLIDGCDYAVQTLRGLGHANIVYGLLLGEPITWTDILTRSGRYSFVLKEYRSILFRPIFLVPGQRFFWIKQLNYFLNAVALRFYVALRHRNRKKLLWFFEPWNMLPIYRAFTGYTTLYDCVDYYAPLRYEDPSIERSLIRRVTVMTCISQKLLEMHQSIRNDIWLVPAGFAEDSISESRAKITKNRGHVVGFIGGINYRFDFDLLTRVIRSLPDVTFVFVGPIQMGLIRDESELSRQIDQLFTFPNVWHIPSVSKKDIGRYTRTFDIGIIPYDIRYPFNRFSFPMKVMEYFWFGLPVISTDIASLRSYSTLISIEHTAQGWIQRIREYQTNKIPKEVREQKKRIALTHTWKHKLEVISLHLVLLMDTDESSRQSVSRQDALRHLSTAWQ